MKHCYIEKKFNEKSKYLIAIINKILDEYGHQGYELTLRQVYYQLVARGFIENTEQSYKRIGKLINDARLAGEISWYAIIDRTRSLRKNSHWEEPQEIISSARYSYMLDRRESQPHYIEVWVEKDALIGIVGQVASQLDVPYFSCRGYTSQSEMWNAAQRIRKQRNKESRTIIHLGDHDPSGIDMSRDIQERLDLFDADVHVKRVALTMEQIDKYSPPPNPTKVTDSRANSYIKKYGHECWELDALNPDVIKNLIISEVNKLSDQLLINHVIAKEDEDKKTLELIEHNFMKVKIFLEDIAR